MPVLWIREFQVFLLSDFLLFQCFLGPAHKAEKHSLGNLAGPRQALEKFLSEGNVGVPGCSAFLCFRKLTLFYYFKFYFI